MSSAVIHSAMSRTRNWATLPVLFLAVGPTIARAAAAAFLAQGKPKLGGADGALREDHLVYGQVARGQPYDANNACKKPSRLVPYRP